MELKCYNWVALFPASTALVKHKHLIRDVIKRKRNDYTLFFFVAW